ncbi:MAG: hypothetical protein R2744_06705 [Bacteroidales bacterium]
MVEDTTIGKLVYLDTINCVFEQGRRYDIDAIQGEMLRIERFIRDLGYYSFSKDNIKFEVDTTIGNHQVDIRYQVLQKQRRIGFGGITTWVPHHRYRIHNIYIYDDFDPKSALSSGDDYFSSLDTTEYRGSTLSTVEIHRW